MRRLDPGSETLRDGYERIVEKYGSLDFDDWEARRTGVIETTTRGPESRLWSLGRRLDDRLDQAEAEVAHLRDRLIDSEARAAAETDRLTRLLADAENREAQTAGELARLHASLAESEAVRTHLASQLEALSTSTSWRLTAPLRRGADLVRRIGGA